MPAGRRAPAYRTPDECSRFIGQETNRLGELAPHKDYLVGQKHILVVGGTLLAEGADGPVGSLDIVNAADRQAAEALA